MTEAEIRQILKYHQVTDPDTVGRMELVRQLVTEATVEVSALLPHSRERSLFITHMQEGQMMAIASLAIHGAPDEPTP